jgi:hypothetical protein
MKHIELNAQEEAVKEFWLTHQADPEGAILELDGQAVARLVPIAAAGSSNHSGDCPWTKEKNSRRCFLIDREIDGTLTPEEASELAALQRQMLEYRQRVAPLPLEASRRLYEELLEKAEATQLP